MSSMQSKTSQPKLAHLLKTALWLGTISIPSCWCARGSNESILTAGDSSNGSLDCALDLREFDPRIHKQKYRIAVYSTHGFEKAFIDYNLTFSEYLTATAGRRFDLPIEFEMVPTLMHDLYDAVETEDVDFFFANPGMYSCLGVEYGAQPLATVISRLEARGHIFDLDVFGGVMFTQADNDEVNTILDFKDKVIGAGSYAMIMGGPLQFYEMTKAGMSHVMDPKQVVFTHNQDYVIDGVIDGEFDIGFVRTDEIERHKDAAGNLLDPDIFKIIEPKIYVLDDGHLFPFLHSTDIYPEWPIAALRHVPKDVSEEVRQALLALSAHEEAGEALHGCENSNCEKLVETHATRCDTTTELAELAYEASHAGVHVGFRNARSYFEVRTMQEAAGLLKQDEKGKWKCTRADSFYEGIDCPEGHYKIPEDEFDRSCTDLGLTCKEGYDCYCKPCVEAFEVDVFQYTGGHIDDFSHRGCGKMSLCGSVEQTKEITFRAIDNKKREDATVTAKMHIGKETTELVVQRVEDLSNEDATYVYDFHWSENTLGVGILEVYVDGEQIAASPIRVQVVERRCEVDYPGEGKTSSASGNCVCREGKIHMRGKCVNSTVISIVFALAALLIISFFGVLYLRYRNRKADEMWQVNVDELQFDDPVEVIGSGSFGEVFLADYRGTKVAIKRAIKSTGRRGSTRSGSKSRRKQSSMTGSGSVGVVSSGYSNGACDSRSEDSEITPETHHDVKCPPQSDGGSSVDNFFPQGRSHKSADGFSIAFLADDYGQASKWAWLFPWLKKRDYQYHFRQTILGGASASISRSTLTAAFCPCVDKSSRQREEFISEMRVLSRLRHPCITTVMGAVVTYTHDPLLIMEYMDYGSLHDLLRNDTMYLSGEIIMQVSRDIAQGLRYLHSSRPPILHGDLKARNILIDSRFRAKLCDFGLSTKTKNTVTGTPFWLAPEYLRGQNDYNCACDMYSVGIILFEIYSRKNPYEGENFRDVLRKVCDRRVNKRPKIPATAPPKMADLMKKCWSPDPNFRPQAKDLDTTLMDMSIQDAEPVDPDDQDEKKKRTTTDMLNEIFPRHIAEALKAGKKVEPESHDLVTVVFSDIVHFTDISREISPLKVSTMLDRLYLAFDRIARKHQVFKVETIGDAYMGVTNLENNQEGTHVKQVAEFAIDMIDEAGKILVDEEDPSKGFINIRVGFHSGPVVSNVIGSLNPRYGLFGDTVNTASRMESNSKGNRILCSEKSFKLLKEQDPDIPVSKRGKIRVKGKGDMTVYWVGLGSKKNANPEQAVKHVEFADDVPVAAEELPSQEVPGKDTDLPAVDAFV